MAYLIAPLNESDGSSRGLHTHVAFSTCAGVHSNILRREKCATENINALPHAMVATTVRNTLNTCLTQKQQARDEVMTLHVCIFVNIYVISVSKKLYTQKKERERKSQ